MEQDQKENVVTFEEPVVHTQLTIINVQQMYNQCISMTCIDCKAVLCNSAPIKHGPAKKSWGSEMLNSFNKIEEQMQSCSECRLNTALLDNVQDVQNMLISIDSSQLVDPEYNYDPIISEYQQEKSTPFYFYESLGNMLQAVENETATLDDYQDLTTVLARIRLAQSLTKSNEWAQLEERQLKVQELQPLIRERLRKMQAEGFTQNQ